MVDFENATKEPMQKREDTLIAVGSRQAALTKFVVLCTKNQTAEIDEEALVDKIKESLSEKVTEVGSLTRSPCPASYSQVATFSSSSSRPAAISPTSVRIAPQKKSFKVIIYPNEEAKNIKSSEDRKTLLAKAVNSKELNIKPERIIKIRNNGLLIESATKDIEQLIDNTDLRKANLSAAKPAKIWPKVVCYDVPENLSKDEFLDCVQDGIQEKVELNEGWCKNVFKIGLTVTTGY